MCYTLFHSVLLKYFIIDKYRTLLYRNRIFPHFPERSLMQKRNTNWHIATTSAIRIDLRDYSDILSYDTEVLI